jgi:hypothetical protein
MTRPIRRALLLIALLAACGEDGGGDPSDAGTIAADGGGGQSAVVGSTLAPYQVKVTDLNGAPKEGVTVTWTVQLGGGSVAPGSSVTDAQGLAEATATLGLVAGTQTVRASAAGYDGSPVSFTSTGTPDVPTTLSKFSGDNQSAPPGSALPAPLVVRVQDQHGNPVPGVTVDWAVTSGSGTTNAASSVTNAQGQATMNVTLPDSSGSMTVEASVTGIAQAVSFTMNAVSSFAVLGGGNNVPERYTSDLWVADGFAYTGSWQFRSQQGNAVKIWQLSQSGAPTLKTTLVVPNVGTISDIEVSPDGKWLVFTAEGGTAAGIHVYELTSPGNPVFRASLAVSSGLHTGALSVIGGKLYAFTAKNPLNPSLNIYDLSAAGSGTITPVGSFPIPPNYGIHDTFVRDGLAFVFAWDEGLYLLDVGDGRAGGSPSNPQLIKHAGNFNSPLFGGQTHNGWWFHNPTNGEKRYLFIGEEGPGIPGTSSSGDIHVVDVSDFNNPVEVAFYHLAGAGAHNFWMDEPRQILYAAFYNGGVVALDVSGALSGNLANREIARIQPGGAGNTYVWGVMLYNGSLYVSDMLSGFWQLRTP